MLPGHSADQSQDHSEQIQNTKTSCVPPSPLGLTEEEQADLVWEAVARCQPEAAGERNDHLFLSGPFLKAIPHLTDALLKRSKDRASVAH